MKRSTITNTTAALDIIKPAQQKRQTSESIDLGTEVTCGLLDVCNSPVQLKPIVEIAAQGLKKGFAPELSEEGVGGTYFLRDDRNHKVGVFKPLDEEPYHDNNPKGYRRRADSDMGIKSGIMIGEAAIRECAAYLLDHEHFASVPATDLALCKHPSFSYKSSNSISSSKQKIGSLQAFADHDGDCEDISRNIINEFPIDEVHKIAQLDIRILNTDRHGGNILYKEIINEDTGDIISYKLIPIDHGFSLPSNLCDSSFEWMNWPQSHSTICPNTLNYIQKLDVEKDINLLKEKFGESNIRSEHERVLRLGMMILKKCTINGLNFNQIGNIMIRSHNNNFNNPSIIENIVTMATDLSNGDNNSNVFYSNVDKLLMEYIQYVKSSYGSPSLSRNTPLSIRKMMLSSNNSNSTFEDDDCYYSDDDNDTSTIGGIGGDSQSFKNSPKVSLSHFHYQHHESSSVFTMDG